MKPSKKFLDTIRYLEVAHGTNQFPFALSDMLKEIVVELRQKPFISRIGKSHSNDRFANVRKRHMGC